MHEGHRERLRERYISSGLTAFADHEILELLLSYAIARKDTNPIAHQLLNRFGSLSNVMHAEIKELMQIPGIGERAAVYLKMQGDLLAELSVRSTFKKRERLETPALVAAFALDLTATEHYEAVYVVSLDKNLQLLHAERLFSGTLTETPLYPRRIVESALQHRAHSILLLHNHPSGDPTPSESDLTATDAVRQALHSIDIRLFDHIVTGRDIVYSCARQIYIDRAQHVYDTFPTSGILHVPNNGVHMAAEKETK
ncbi:DNA repair protein RadC [Christensenellaceae bacterium OttesenSCG-928-L17]|nr:DNA repair protein RadC [Christensenellaceae bacterium OttesenSCG-928-L17]